MLRFIKCHLTSIDGVAFWPTIAFILFFSVFVGVVWWVFTVDRRHLEHLSRTPLNDTQGSTIQ